MTIGLRLQIYNNNNDNYDDNRIVNYGFQVDKISLTQKSKLICEISYKSSILTDHVVPAVHAMDNYSTLKNYSVMHEFRLYSRYHVKNIVYIKLILSIHRYT